MKLLKFAFFIFLLLVGYIIGDLFPLDFSRLAGRSIEGNTVLQVKAFMDNGTPVPKLEIDLDVQPGPPAKGGASYTDENGIATFKVKPGDYVIYFNSGTFPKNLNMIGIMPVTVEAGKVNEKTLYFKAK